ncbi:MAG: DUF6680 family protein [Candidatus Acidiferrales bacterium]
MQPSYWGLTISEWLTITAIVLGPILAVAMQLAMQARKAKRDQKLWVFNTLMGLRATIVNETFVQAFNLVDVVFYKHPDIRKKRQQFLSVTDGAAGRELTAQELDRCKDLVAEMLAKIGRELGFVFDHSEIKNTGYYPAGLAKLPTAALAVLEGGASLGVVIKK